MKKVIIVLNLFFLIYSSLAEVNIPTQSQTTAVNIPTPSEKAALKQVENLLKESIAQSEHKDRKLHRRRRKRKRRHRRHKKHHHRRRRRKRSKKNRKALLGGLLTHCHEDDPDCVLSLKQQEVQGNYRNFLNPHADGINKFLGIHDLKDAAAAGAGVTGWVYSNYKNKKRKHKLRLRKNLMNEKKAFEDVYVKILRKENSRIDGVNNELMNLDKRLGSYQNEICGDIQAKSMAHENRVSSLRRYDND